MKLQPVPIEPIAVEIELRLVQLESIAAEIKLQPVPIEPIAVEMRLQRV